MTQETFLLLDYNGRIMEIDLNKGLIKKDFIIQDSLYAQEISYGDFKNNIITLRDFNLDIIFYNY